MSISRGGGKPRSARLSEGSLMRPAPRRRAGLESPGAPLHPLDIRRLPDPLRQPSCGREPELPPSGRFPIYDRLAPRQTLPLTQPGPCRSRRRAPAHQSGVSRYEVTGVRGGRTHPGLQPSPTTVMKVDEPRTNGFVRYCSLSFHSENPGSQSIRCRQLPPLPVEMGGNWVATQSPTSQVVDGAGR